MYEVLGEDEKCGKSPDFDGAGVFSGSIGNCFGVSSKERKIITS